MQENIRRLRIFVASPSDVQEERDRLTRVVAELRDSLGDQFQLDLFLKRWETHTTPGVADYAQDVINRQIGDYDLFVAIFWNRMGTPTPNAESGSREEFDRAYALYQQDTARIDIWVYFSQQPFNPTSVEQLEQKTKVMAFRNDIQTRKGVSSRDYRDPDDFEGQVRRHLLQLIGRLTSSGETAALTTKRKAGEGAGGASAANRVLRQRYLRAVWDACFNLKLPTVDIRSQGRAAAELELNAVFTDLDVKDTEQEAALQIATDRQPVRRADRTDEQRLPAMTALVRYPKLVLLGDPGSGKSTLVSFVALCLAGDGLEDPTVNRRRLGKAWKLTGVLPLRVILRDYAARGLPRDMGLWQFIKDELDASLADCIPAIESTLAQQNGALVLLDGVDEVPEAQRCRVRLKQKIEEFGREFSGCRLLVTSRPYAYQDPDAFLAGFKVRTLADFSPKQVQTFITRWYDHVGQQDPSLGLINARRYAEQLKAAVQSNPRLADLAPRPLLLTLMASLHRWREGGGLPEQRQELYEAAVRLLLDLWQRPKQIFDAQGRLAGTEYDVWKELGIGAEALRSALNQIAYEAHLHQSSTEGTHDIPVRDIVGILYEQSDKTKTGSTQDTGEKRIVEYLTNRAGLLIERSQARVYAFPHRTFQEYLAACHLADTDFPFLLADRLREDDGRWREASLLAAAKAASGSKSTIWNLVGGFCPHDWPPHSAAEPADWYAAVRAAQALIETEQHKNVPERQAVLITRLKDWLVALLEGGHLPPRERAAAGQTLAQLGDPRFEPSFFHLPRLYRGRPEPHAGFVQIAPGPFVMGSRKDDKEAYDNEYGPSGKPQTLTIDYPYWVARYPTTAAQFGRFIEAGGYEDKHKQWWTPAGWAWRQGQWDSTVKKDWLRDWLKRRPKDLRGAPMWWDEQRIDNQPVYGVCWFEAMAYCAWLDAQVKERQKAGACPLLIPEDYALRLPTEAEWEKAARCGDARRYPWGDNEWDEQRANIENVIGAVTAVGMYPLGATPATELYDLSGNVGE